MALFDDVEDLDRFIECTRGKDVTIHIDQRDIGIHKLLVAGFHSPKWVDGKLSLSRGPEDTRTFMYLRETVIPPLEGETLSFSPSLVRKLKELSRSTLEWGGMFVFVGGTMELSTVHKGTETTVHTKQDLSRYMFHTHPHTSLFPYSIFSVPDLNVYILNRQRYGGPRKDFLVTPTGILSIQVSSDLAKIYPKIRMLILMVHQYVVDTILFRDSEYVTIYESIDFMNKLTGEVALETVMNKGLLTADEVYDVTKYANQIVTLKRFYFVNYKEWDGDEYKDVLVDM